MLCMNRMALHKRFTQNVLDVDNDGGSFGHTGAMDGTSTSVRHDQSGLTWALLLNSWSKDTDLDGMIKYAMSTVQCFPFWQRMKVKFDLTYDPGDCLIISEDKLQCLTILLPYEHVMSHVTEMQVLGYKIEHVCIISSIDVKFNMVWKKSGSKWLIHMDVLEENFEDCVSGFEDKWRVYAIEAYESRSQIFLIILCEAKLNRGKNLDQKCYVLKNLTEHGRCVERFQKTGYSMVTQSILSTKDGALVSCIYEKVSVCIYISY